MAAYGPAQAQAQEGGSGDSRLAAAQVPAAGARASLEEIIVTARKVAENLQDVPVAVTAFTGDALERQNAVKLSDIQGLTPGLIMRPGTLTGASLLLTLRGQVNVDNLASSDPSVGVYVDGLYVARAYGIDANLMDIESVQVLKGPQGTLFGRNTTGGAIIIQTHDPVLNELSGRASASFGRHDYISGTGILNLPVVDDKVALRGAFEISDSKGYARDSITGMRYGEDDKWNARLKLLVKPTESLSVLLSADIHESKFNADPWYLRYVAPSWTNSGLSAGAQILGTDACFADMAGCIATGFAGIDSYIRDAAENPNSPALSVPAHIDVRTRTFGGTVSLDTSFGEIKFIGGYRKVANDNVQDQDGSHFTLYQLASRQRLEQWSGELQATGALFNDRLTFAAGAFYFEESGTDASHGQAFGPPLSQAVTLYFGDVDSKSVGVYGQGSFDLTDRLALTAGLRYSKDDKGITVNNQTLSQGTIFEDPFWGTPGFTVPPGATLRCDVDACPQSREDDFSGVSWTAGLDYRINPDVMVYAKVAKGFRSGGQNLRATRAQGQINPFVPFEPEKALSYEAGLKSDLLENRIRLNLAAYFSELKDLQRRSIVVVEGVGTTIIGNAGKAHVYGGEAELQAVLFEGFRLGGTVGYTHPEYKDYVNPFTGFDRRGDRFDGVAKWQYSISGNYTRDLSFGRLMLNADWAWLGKFPLNEINYYVDGDGVVRSTSDGSAFPSVAAAEALVEANTSHSAGQLNARAALSFADDKYELAVWGRNLTGSRRWTVQTLLNTISVGGLRAEPFMFGVTGTVRFGS